MPFALSYPVAQAIIALIGLLVPALMVVSSQSCHLTVPLLLGAGVLTVGRDSGLRSTFLSRLGGDMRHPLWWIIAMFVLWMLLSSLWSADAARTVLVTLQFSGMYLICWAGARALPLITASSSGVWLVAGLVLTALLMLEELYFFMPLRHLARAEINEAMLNKGYMLMALLVWPAMLWLVRAKARLLDWVLWGFLLLASLPSFSGATTFGLLCGMTGFILAGYSPVLAVWAVGTGLCVVVMLTPLLMLHVNDLFPQSWHDMLASTSSHIRGDIWHWFAQVWQLAPLKGVGVDVTRMMGALPQVQDYPPEGLWALRVGHPHNAILQIWVELGAVGAVLLCIGLILMFRLILRLEEQVRRYVIGAVCCTFSIAYVSHGAWQMWWWAAIGLMVCWFCVLLSCWRIHETRT